MLGRKTVYLVVSIDTECDKGPGWKTQYPLRFESVTSGIPTLLMPLFGKHGIKPTFLLSPEVLQDQNSIDVLLALEDCEFGTHLHGEYIEPQTNYYSPVTSSHQLAYTPELEWAKLRNLTTLFEHKLGRRPLSFRAGRFSLSPNTLVFLDRLGYRVDTSVTPFRTNRYQQDLQCNYWGAPLHPYHPSKKDPRKIGKLHLLEVPLTISIPALAKWPAFILRQISDHSSWRKQILSSLGIPLDKLWLRPFRGTPSELIDYAEIIIENWKKETPVVLNVMFHSVEAISMASPYAQNDNEVAYLLESLNKLFESLLQKYQVESVGLSDLYARWVSQ